MNVNQIESTLESSGQQFASLYGEPFEVMRPDYTQYNSPENLVFQQNNFHVSPNNKEVELPVSGVNYFQVVGTRQIKLGDVLIPQQDNPAPVLTLVSAGRGKPYFAIYTDLIGRITNGADDGAATIYDNVRFQLFNLPSVGEGLDSSLLGSLGASVQRAILFNNRPGIQQGMWLRWSVPGVLNNGTISKAARIEATKTHLYQLVLNLSDNPGG